MLPLSLLLLLGTGAAAAAPGPTYHPGSSLGVQETVNDGTATPPLYVVDSSSL